MGDASQKDVFRQRFVLAGDGAEAREVQEKLLSAVEQRSYDPSACFAIRLALEEALANAFKHGSRNDPSKTVNVDCCVNDDEVVIDVRDEGLGFDPSTVPDPTETENLEIPCGRGIVLMRSFMTQVEFDKSGNRVRMVYARTQLGRD